MSLATILTLIFVVLKLTHYIDWSWWLVLLPMLMQLALILTVAIYVETLTPEEKLRRALRKKYKL